jgi:hypothetical protein
MAAATFCPACCATAVVSTLSDCCRDPLCVVVLGVGVVLDWPAADAAQQSAAQSATALPAQCRFIDLLLAKKV